MKNSCYIERDISLVRFNKRVAEEASIKTSPIFERFKFLSIFNSNMREFYQIRVGSMFDDLAKEKEDTEKYRNIENLLSQVLQETKKVNSFTAKTYFDIVEDFQKFGFKLINFSTEIEDSKPLKDYFKKNVLPILSPRIVAKNDVFMHLETDDVTLAVEFAKEGKPVFGLCSLPGNMEKVFIEKDQSGFSVHLVEDIILKYADKIFGGMKIKQACLIKLVRNADIDVDEARGNVGGYRNMLSLLLNRRSSLYPVRIDFKGDFSGDMKNFIVKRTKFIGNHIFKSKSPLDFSFVKDIEDFAHFAGIVTKSNLKGLDSVKFTPCENLEYQNAPSIIEYAKEKDMLFNYPYNTMKPFLRFMEECSVNKAVKVIKMTLYRVSSNSAIVNSLCKAAENGKKVTVLIELKARFDEINNIEVSRQLQQAGCSVHLGVAGYKVHSKIVTVEFKDKSALTYIGTGNFHEVTVKLYSDLGILTADPIVAKDANMFFDEITLKGAEDHYEKLLVTPHYCKNQLLDLVDNEILKVSKGKKGSITIKCNALTHVEFIEKLVEASKVGVEIQLIVRGACMLLPGVLGETENITLRSIVGEFLEHTRIYKFGEGATAKIIIGSCDIMTRNLDHRFEISYMVEDKNIKGKINNILKVQLKDNVKARICDSEGEYYTINCEKKRKVHSQNYMKRRAVTENKKFQKSIKK